jgi:ABC-type transport system involved in cytochrome bd biosynthesis fused ATPase/permease subunit
MGQILAIVGQSGAGKTTLLDLIGGLNSPSNGGIYFSTKKKSNDRGDAKPKIGYVSQNSVLFGADIYEAVSFNPESTYNEKNLIEETLVVLNLKQLIPSDDNKISINIDGSNISGGERQRIAFARAIIGDSQLYILDEPTSSLDSKNKEIVIGLVKEIAKHSIVVLVTHDKELLNVATKVLQMDDGKVNFFGEAKDFYEN